jgi:P-type Cu+ transporter
MKKIKLTIEGMHCASCSANVEKSLKKINGVKEANVNIMTKKGIVESEFKISIEDIEKAVSKAGYKVVKIEED